MELTGKIGKAVNWLRGKNVEEYIFKELVFCRSYLSCDKQIQWVYDVVWNYWKFLIFKLFKILSFLWKENKSLKNDSTHSFIFLFTTFTSHNLMVKW